MDSKLSENEITMAEKVGLSSGLAFQQSAISLYLYT